MNHQRSQAVPSNRLIVCGLLGIVGALAVILTDIAGIILVEKHNPITETISKLAVGQHAWIQDLGLNVLAVGMAALGIGLHWWYGGADWKLRSGAFLLMLLAVDIFFISEYNQYVINGGTGYTVHMYSAYLLAGLFAVVTVLLAFGLRQVGKDWFYFSLGTAISWTLLTPVYLLIPTQWNGAFERFLGLVFVTWTVGLSRQLILQGRRSGEDAD